MLPAAQAERLILDVVQPLDCQQDVEVVDLLSAAGRILATPVTSQLDFPHWDNSAMDGYAIRYVDVQACSAEHPVTLEIIEDIPAGYQPQKTIGAGQAARILTGSMMPPGADTVVMQEDTVRQGGDRVTIVTSPKPQAFVRHRGTYYKAGNLLLPAGVFLAAPEIAVLAAAQCLQVTVYRRPRVAIFSTGSELVTPDQPLQTGQIVDSNQYALAAAVQQAGAEPILLGIVPDQPEVLREAIAHALTIADLVLSSGGVSVGDYDYVDQILSELGAEIRIRSVAVKPGKPLTVATFEGVRGQGLGSGRVGEWESGRVGANPSPHPPFSSYPSPVIYFGLPGNPVSALVTFWRFVQPALQKLSGLAHVHNPIWVKGRSLHNLKSDGKRESYLWGQTRLVNGEYEFQLASGSHLSGNLINLAETNSLAVLPIGTSLISITDPVTIMIVKPLSL
jgi:molybdopterin molybdotransferase